tara:strand:- start:91 stop:216 length:126 start_codon:yes stop_codon:yes gene_type:complete
MAVLDRAVRRVAVVNVYFFIVLFLRDLKKRSKFGPHLVLSN